MTLMNGMVSDVPQKLLFKIVRLKKDERGFASPVTLGILFIALALISFMMTVIHQGMVLNEVQGIMDATAIKVMTKATDSIKSRDNNLTIDKGRIRREFRSEVDRLVNQELGESVRDFAITNVEIYAPGDAGATNLGIPGQVSDRQYFLVGTAEAGFPSFGGLQIGRTATLVYIDIFRGNQNNLISASSDEEGTGKVVVRSVTRTVGR